MAAMDGIDYGFREVDGAGSTYRKLEGVGKTRDSIRIVSQRIEGLKADLQRHEENWSRGSTTSHNQRSTKNLISLIANDEITLNKLEAKLAKQLKEEAKREEERRLQREARMEEYVWDGEVRDEDVEEVRESKGLGVSEDGRVRAMW
jgi:hypothetical protein